MKTALSPGRFSHSLPLLLLVAAAALPFLWRDPYYLQILLFGFLFATLGSAWNLVGGYAGQLSLGHAAFFGVGAYAVALLGERGWSPWVAWLAGGVLAVPFALFIGSVAFRLRGPYFALSTIALAEILHLVTKHSEFTHGAVGAQVPSLFSGDMSRLLYYELALALLAVVVTVTAWLASSRTGYYWMAIRENEDTAQAITINTAAYKLLALVISAFFTALAGGIYGSYLSFIAPEVVLSFDISAQAAIFSILGGVGTIWGPVVGASILTLASELFRSQFKDANLLIYGLLIILVVLYMPKGVVGVLSERLAKRRAARAAAASIRA
ncbi:MAG: branched-chain amino acid ABC transporter permease [Firmicutes bacterium]|nr:branched-chain amino acid ABC transporter permease [Bacillota bacterium]